MLQLKIKLRTKVRREDNLRTEMSHTNKMMVKIRFEGKKLADCDFWTKSDPYLLICRPSRTGKGLIHVSYFSYSIVKHKENFDIIFGDREFFNK